MKKYIIAAGIEIGIGLGLVIYAELSAALQRRKLEKMYKKILRQNQKMAVARAEEIMRYKRS